MQTPADRSGGASLPLRPMQSKASTVDAYLKSLPADRRAAICAVREVILKNLDKDYEEGMQYGMIGYCVPHRVFPAGYHCDPKQPLCFAGLASQKNHMAVYLMCVYGSKEQEAWFRGAWGKTGKKLDMGKSCIRFKRVEDLALDVLGEAVRRVPAKKYIENYTRLLEGMDAARAARKSAKASVGKPVTRANPVMKQKRASRGTTRG
ncbi:hypothetical protein PHYC_00068 [Phycisphaerales bacterium]|nr:hypothetical protein PHYC_00068 [Phycisphaerales bacterium]